MTESIFTPAARRHAVRLARSIAPFAARLDRSFRRILRRRSYGAAEIRALLAITPAALSRLLSLGRFLEQVLHTRKSVRARLQLFSRRSSPVRRSRPPRRSIEATPQFVFLRQVWQ